MTEVQPINGSWNQAVAVLIHEYITTSELGREEAVKSIVDLLNKNTTDILSEIKNISIVGTKSDPIVQIVYVNKYINTETTRTIYVTKTEYSHGESVCRHYIRPPVVIVKELDRDPRSEWVSIGNGWEEKIANFGRQYYRLSSNKKVIDRNKYLSMTGQNSKTNSYYEPSFTSGNGSW